MSDLALPPLTFTQESHSLAENGISLARLLGEFPLAMGLPFTLDFQTAWVIFWIIFPFLFILASKITGKEWIREHSAIALIVSIVALGLVYRFFWWYLGYCVVVGLLWWWFMNRYGGPRE